MYYNQETHFSFFFKLMFEVAFSQKGRESSVSLLKGRYIVFGEEIQT